MRRLGIAATIALGGCFEPASDSGQSSDSEYIPDDVPSGNCGETDNDPCTSSGAEAEDGCSATNPCSGGMFCSASFDGDIGRFDCRAACVPDLDETRWCVDDAACCEIGSVCRGRGLCVPAEATSTGIDPDTGSDSGSSEASGGFATTSTTGDTGTSDTGTSDTGTTGAALVPDARPILR